LRASTLLRGSIDSLDDAFALYDPDDRLVLCNQRSLEAYPLSADLMVPGALFEHIIRKGAERGQYAQALGRIDAWVAERMALHRQPASMLTQRLSDGRTLRIVERRMPDGHTVVFRVDITELVRATEAAQAASHAMSRFLANMSHEIRTPMNAVLGMLTLLQRTELTPRQADYAAKADRAARSLLGLLNEILQFSKIEEGKTTLEALPFELEALLRELAVIVSGSAARKALEVRFEVDPALPRGWVGDAMRLRQVLVNLLGNAVKFTEQGEVVLQIALRSLDTTAAAIEFVVNDTGIGIAPENHARIFSGFTQAEVSTTRRFGGTGLGLAISQRLIRLMGGELALDSELGRGSRFSFCITLPVTDKRTVGLLRDRHGVPRARLVRACSCAGARGAAAHEQGVALGGGRGRRRWAGSDAAAAAGGGRCALPCDVRGCAHVCVGCCAGAAAPVRRRNERRAGHRSHRDGRRPRPRPARTTRRKPMHHAGPR